MHPYIALIHKAAASDYGVSFPDLPGCISAGRTLDEARDMAAEALAFHLEGLAADGEAIPAPSTLEAIMADPESRDGVAILVETPESSQRAVRLNITLPENLVTAIDAHAEEHGLTRSGFLARAARQSLESGSETARYAGFEDAAHVAWSPADLLAVARQMFEHAATVQQPAPTPAAKTKWNRKSARLKGEASTEKRRRRSEKRG